MRWLVRFLRWPSDQVDRVFDVYAKRSLRNEATFVHEPRRARYLFWRTVVVFVVALGSIPAETFIPEANPAGDLVTVVQGWLMGCGVMLTVGRAISYKHGWLDGRQDALLSLGPLFRGEVALNEWSRAQLFRDLDTLGATPEEAAGLIDDLERQAFGKHERGDE